MLWRTGSIEMVSLQLAFMETGHNRYRFDLRACFLPCGKKLSYSALICYNHVVLPQFENTKCISFREDKFHFVRTRLY